MKAVKETKTQCAFCGARVIKRESFAHRMGMRIRKLRVINGYLLITSYSSQLPICKDCWSRAVNLLSNQDEEVKDGRQD